MGISGFEEENEILVGEDSTKTGVTEPLEPVTEGVITTEVEDPRLVKARAREKLENELKAEKDKYFAEPVIGYLLKRCEDDEGLAQDVVQEHKTWNKCFDYIYEQARRQATGNRAAVRDDVVYEWAEDYYHKDDKAEEEAKAKRESEAKAKREKAAAEKKLPKTNVKPSVGNGETEDPTQDGDSKELSRPKKNGKDDMEGQMDLFSMLGI